VSVIRLSGVGKAYRTAEGSTIEALRDIDFAVDRGEFATVVGPSGCGKSTLLRIIAGLDRATAGVVEVEGAPVTGPVASAGIMFQDPLLMAWRTAVNNVLLPIEVLRRDISVYRERAKEMLRLVGLEGFEQRYPHELSGGMQQRVALARALIHDPELLLMDEPFAALDEITREQVGLELLRIWSDTGKTVLFVTHSISEAVFLGDRVVVLSARPGLLRAEISIDLPRPRSAELRGDQRYTDYCQKIRQQLGLVG
jgi:NitT/TauT family transport system ATP-binding protein